MDHYSKMRWYLGMKEYFDIKSFYGALKGSSSITFPWKSIWGVRAPCRVSFFFFFWIAAWGRVLTKDHLRKRVVLLWIGVAFVKVMGGAWIICSYIVVRYFGYGALPLDLFVFLGFYLWSVIDLLAVWQNWSGKHSSNVWNLVPHCAMWIIWRERNNRIFEDSVISEDKLLELFATTLFDWSHAWGFTSTKSIRCF